MKISGVYKITNNITGEFYIGSSKDIKRRWADHKCLSKWKQHPNIKLYKAMAQYSLDNFTFEVLEETADLRNREQYWIEQLKPSYNNLWAKGRNIKRRKETTRRCCKEWNEIHRDERLAKSKDYYSRLCLYNGETLTLNALRIRFGRQGIVNPVLEAKKYLMTGRDLSAEALSKLALSK